MTFENAMEIVQSVLRTNIEDVKDRGTIVTETYSGDGNQTEFYVANKDMTNIIAVSVGGVPKYEFVDYTKNYDNPLSSGSYPSITFNDPPASGTNNVSIEYHYGDTWIYQAFPSEESTVPWISLFHISSRQEESGIGTAENATEKSIKTATWIQLDVWVRRSGDVVYIDGMPYGGIKLLEYFADRAVRVLSEYRPLMKSQGLEEIKLRMARDIEYSETTDYLRKLIDYEVVHTVKWT